MSYFRSFVVSFLSVMIMYFYWDLQKTSRQSGFKQTCRLSKLIWSANPNCLLNIHSSLYSWMYYVNVISRLHNGTHRFQLKMHCVTHYICVYFFFPEPILLRWRTHNYSFSKLWESSYKYWVFIIQKLSVQRWSWLQFKVSCYFFFFLHYHSWPTSWCCRVHWS